MKNLGIPRLIPVTDITEGMQVLNGTTIYTITNPITDKEGYVIGNSKNGSTGIGLRISELKELVVEYENENWDFKPRFIQLPLKYSQWQEVLNDGLVDKPIEYKKLRTGKYGLKLKANIIFQEKKMIYTKEDLWEAWWASAKLNDTISTKKEEEQFFNEWIEEKSKI